MYQLFYKYLILNGEVGVPGMGVFVMQREPARLDMEQKVVHAPATVIKLKSEADTSNAAFYEFLARELHTDVADATRKFNDFAIWLKEEVQLKKWFELPGLGTLTPGVRDEIKFKSSSITRDYYPPVSVERTSRSTVEERVITAVPEPEPEPVIIADDSEVELDEPRKSRDYWWVFAIILALAGIAAIVYYYYYYQPVQY